MAVTRKCNLQGFCANYIFELIYYKSGKKITALYAWDSATNTLENVTSGFNLCNVKKITVNCANMCTLPTNIATIFDLMCPLENVFICDTC